MSTAQPDSSPRDAIVVAASACAAVVVVGVAIALNLEVGWATGVMTSATLGLLYQVPAVAFDWPRVTVDHLARAASVLGDSRPCARRGGGVGSRDATAPSGPAPRGTPGPHLFRGPCGRDHDNLRDGNHSRPRGRRRRCCRLPGPGDDPRLAQDHARGGCRLLRIPVGPRLVPVGLRRPPHRSAAAASIRPSGSPSWYPTARSAARP